MRLPIVCVLVGVPLVAACPAPRASNAPLTIASSSAPSSSSSPLASSSTSAAPVEPKLEAYVAKPLRGPFASVDAFCASLAKEEPPAKCDLAAKPTVRRSTKPIAPFLEVRPLVVHASMAGAPIDRCPLAMRTSAGWFVWNADGTCQGVLGPCSKTTDHVWESIAPFTEGSDARLVIESSSIHGSHSYEEGKDGKKKGGWSFTSYVMMTVCGVGASSAPTCIEPVVVQCTDINGLPLRFGTQFGDGALVTSGEGSCGSGGEPTSGRHPLTFP